MRTVMTCWAFLAFAACGGLTTGDQNPAPDAGDSSSYLDGALSADALSADHICVDPTANNCQQALPQHDFSGSCWGMACSASEFCLTTSPTGPGVAKCVSMPGDCIGLGTGTCACLADYPEPSDCVCNDNAQSQAELECGG